MSITTEEMQQMQARVARAEALADDSRFKSNIAISFSMMALVSMFAIRGDILGLRRKNYEVDGSIKVLAHAISPNR